MLDRLRSTLGEVPSHVHDDRGARVVVREEAFTTPGWIGKPRRGGDKPSEQVRYYLGFRRQARSWLYHLVLSSTILWLGALAVMFGVDQIRGGRPFMSLIPFAIAAGCAYVGVVNPFWMRRRAAWMHRSLFGAGAHCLACNYDLGGSEPQHDGCTVCPECGAAWRLSSRGCVARCSTGGRRAGDMLTP